MECVKGNNSLLQLSQFAMADTASLGHVVVLLIENHDSLEFKVRLN